ncbi:MAG: T9SS type A sorting domain-containing protein [Bacteroidetes bacterium]|nr:T9SS type A sorting domain-containing protein [Bacteroidota bacterium]
MDSKFNWQTSCFKTNFDTIDYGYYDDYVSWPVIFTITNNLDHEITITSASNHLEAYTLGTQLPLNIAAGGSENMVVYFYPVGMGIHDFNDVLTLNYDSYYADTMPQRITRQVVLKGTTIEPLNIDQNIDEQIIISPNPTSGLIQIASSQKKITNVSIYNALGKIASAIKEPRINKFNWIYRDTKMEFILFRLN